MENELYTLIEHSYNSLGYVSLGLSVLVGVGFKIRQTSRLIKFFSDCERKTPSELEEEYLN